MPVTHRSLIAPTANPLLERALREKLARRSADDGSLGELEPLAMRLGLLQNSLKPRLHEPQMVIVAGDHGLAVDSVRPRPGRSTADDVQRLLARQMPLAVFALHQGMNLCVVDAGVADRLPSHERLISRKIAHGTRNTRLGHAMSIEQALAGIRAGMEIGQALPGNVVACAGLGVGGDISAALVLARMTGVPVRELIVEHPNTPQDQLTRQLGVCQTALARHRDVHDPVEVLAAFGGFEMAMMTGMMLATAQRRALLIVDGLAACAALMTASRIAPAVTDYCVFARSQQHQGLNYALQLFHASALLELSMNSSDGSGAALAWPLISAAAALLTEVADGEEAGPTRPSSGYVGLSPAAPMQDDSMVDIPIAAPAAVGTATLMNTIGAIGQGTPADAANSIFTGFGENARPEIDDDLGMSLLDELSAADSTPAPPDSEPPTT